VDEVLLPIDTCCHPHIRNILRKAINYPYFKIYTQQCFNIEAEQRGNSESIRICLVPLWWPEL